MGMKKKEGEKVEETDYHRIFRRGGVIHDNSGADALRTGMHKKHPKESSLSNRLKDVLREGRSSEESGGQGSGLPKKRTTLCRGGGGWDITWHQKCTGTGVTPHGVKKSHFAAGVAMGGPTDGVWHKATGLALM